MSLGNFMSRDNGQKTNEKKKAARAALILKVEHEKQTDFGDFLSLSSNTTNHQISFKLSGPILFQKQS